MPDKTGKKSLDKTTAKRILFKCKFCGEMKPLNDMIVMRQYYPQISACRECAKGSYSQEPAD
jgi:hypothetical protein